MPLGRLAVPALCLTLLLALAPLAGCQKIGEIKDEFDPCLAADDRAYQEAVEPFLVQGMVYNGPATVMKARVLPLTSIVRRAYAQRLAQAHSLADAATRELIAQEQAEAVSGLEVLISIYVPERQGSDLSAPQPDWQIFIIDGAGQRLTPTNLRLIREKERSALNQSLHYFWGYWDRLFRVRFATPAAPARLVVTGAPGRVEMPLRLD